MYYRIRKEPFFHDDPCDRCGQFGGVVVLRTVVSWGKQPKAYHELKCNHCGIQQSTVSWHLDLIPQEDETTDKTGP